MKKQYSNFDRKSAGAGKPEPGSRKKNAGAGKPLSGVRKQKRPGRPGRFEKKERPAFGVRNNHGQARTEKPPVFSELVLAKITGAELAKMDYAAELTLKNESLAKFWRANMLPGKAPEIVASPKARNYRTTSKRKALWKKKLVFSMGYSRDGGEGDGTILEAELHGELYRKILEILNKEHYAPLAKSLNFCVLRGSYDSAAVVMNIAHLDGTVMRKLKLFAAEITAAEKRVSGVFSYLDETRSEYYLEAARPHGKVDFKKLCGNSLLPLMLPDGRKLFYPPTAFSQVNESILPQFTERILGMCKVTEKTRFIDLYCGYGLFGLIAGKQAASVYGMDFEDTSIKAACANAEHLFPEQEFVYRAIPVTGDSMDEFLPPPNGREVILLDPPRNGTSDGVISAVAARHPQRVVAVYCSIDQLAREWHLWRNNGFMLEDACSFDLFPGTAHLETALLLVRK